MTRKQVIGILLTLSITITAYTGIFSSIIPEVSAFTEGEAKFRGVATTDEQWERHDICNGSYYVNVTITEILYDPNHILFLGREVSICYNQSISVETEDEVECYGYYVVYEISRKPVDSPEIEWLVYFGVKVKCVGNDYYIIPEFSSLVILPLFMIGTSATVVCVKKRKRNGD